MNVSRENFPTHINGEEVIGIVQGRKASMRSATFQGMIDKNEMLYDAEENRYHLGLLSSWGMQGRESYPMITKLLERGSELKVKGFDGEFTYDKPFYDPKQGMRTIASTVAEAGDFPGIDESTFDIILSEKCYPGEIIGTDLYGDEEQLYVHSSEASELNGQGWRTTVTLASGIASYHYNPALLESNITYYKINTAYGEMSQGFAGVDVPNGHPTGVLKARFKLGGIRGVEGSVSAFADAMGAGKGFNAINGKDPEAERAMASMKQQYKADSDADTVIFGSKNPSELPNVRATSLMEFLVEKTLMKRTATSHMWQRQGEIKSGNGVIYLNEGVWHQLRRGKIIKVPKIYGITKSHIAQAVEYVYRNNPSLPWEEREIVFETGTLGQDNLLLLFQNEIQNHFSALTQAGANAQMFKVLFGNDGILPENLRTGLVQGSDLNNLQITQLIRFTKVPLIGIGMVSFKFNVALDYLSGNPTEFRGQGLPKGKDWTSHSLIIWDVKDQQYSNNMRNIDGAVTMEGDSKIKDNLYLVTPEEGMMFKGRENGRWDKGMTNNIISSSRFMGQTFWAFNASAQWVPYPENVVMIELSEGARRAGSTTYSF